MEVCVDLHSMYNCHHAQSLLAIQYIEILEWYITDEFKENDPVAKFITQDNKNQKMALQIIKDKKHDLHEMLADSWDKISESIVEKFYDDLLKDFQKGTKIGKDIYKADSAYNEIGKTGWQMVFYKKAREKLEFDYFIILADESHIYKHTFIRKART